MYPQPVPRPRPWYARWWLWVIVGVVVLAFPVACTAVVGSLVVGAVSSSEAPAAAPSPTSTVTFEAAEPSARPSVAPVEPEVVEPSVEPETPEPAEPTESLADKVWATVLEGFPDGISYSSPLYPVTGVEDMYGGTIRVDVQDRLSDQGRSTIAQHIFQLGAWDLTALDTIVVTDATGIDSNHYRRDFPHLPQ